MGRDPIGERFPFSSHKKKKLTDTIGELTQKNQFQKHWTNRLGCSKILSA